jgi:hypothetical protein
MKIKLPGLNYLFGRFSKVETAQNNEGRAIMTDTTSKRKGRMQALRKNAPKADSAEDTQVDEGQGDEAGRGGRARRAGGRGRASGGGFRTKILSSLTTVEEGDAVIEGTEVGQKQLEKFIGALDKRESDGKGAKLKEKITEILSPVETDDGFQFDTDGVNKLVAFLQEEPKRGAGAGAGGGRAGGGRGAGRAGGGAGRAGAGRGAGRRAGGAGRQGGGRAAGGQRGEGAGKLRSTIDELTKKVEELSKSSES